jgi:hypothetical protein
MVGFMMASDDGGVGDEDGGNQRGEDTGVEVREIEGVLGAMLEEGSEDIGVGVGIESSLGRGF